MSLPNPDDNDFYLDHLRTELRAALRKGGLDIAPRAMLDALCSVVLVETQALRVRAACIVDEAARFCDGSLDQGQLERLAYILLVHQLMPDGSLLLPPEDDDPPLVS